MFWAIVMPRQSMNMPEFQSLQAVLGLSAVGGWLFWQTIMTNLPQVAMLHRFDLTHGFSLFSFFCSRHYHHCVENILDWDSCV